MDCEDACGGRRVRVLAELLLAFVDGGGCERCASGVAASVGGVSVLGGGRYVQALEGLHCTVEGSKCGERERDKFELLRSRGISSFARVDGSVDEQFDADGSRSVPPVAVGTDGSGLGVPRGKNWKKNQRKAASKKAKNQRVEAEFVEGVKEKPKDALRLSLEKKWALENELKAAKAARELELLKAEDLDAVKKLRERKVQGATERTMVQIEKAHASLVRSGDVPGVQPGFCQTVVDGEIVESVPGLSSNGGSGECSISPSSSISEREVREMKKELEDVKAENERLKKKDYRISEALKVKGGDDIAVSVRYGDVAESAKEAFDNVCGVGSWEATGDLDLDPDTLYVGLKNEVYCGGYDYSY